jgi:hypothetical protein
MSKLTEPIFHCLYRFTLLAFLCYDDDSTSVYLHRASEKLIACQIWYVQVRKVTRPSFVSSILDGSVVWLG